MVDDVIGCETEPIIQDVLVRCGLLVSSDATGPYPDFSGAETRLKENSSQVVTEASTSAASDEFFGLHGAISVFLDLETCGGASGGIRIEPSSTGSMIRKSIMNGTETMEAEHVEEILTDMLSFSGCEELLRGTRLSTIMAGRCALFRHSKGSALTFSKSERTASLDAFVSHNWSVPARKKFLVLSYFYNGDKVAIATLVGLAAIGVGNYFHVLPEVEDKTLDGRTVGCLGRLLWFPVGTLFFVFWWDICPFFRYRGPTLFLDKVCIHQTDAELMLRGISKLGAFIKDSKQMLSLYSEEYLRRLWTVYEIATFLSIHKTKDLILLPTTVPVVVVVAMIVLWLMHIAHVVTMLFSDNSYMRTFSSAAACVSFLWALRVLFRKKKAMIATIATFSVQKCVCAQESDRAQVYLNIEALMRRMKTFKSEATQEEVLAAFDQQVRDELPQALKKQMGKFLLPYHKVCVMCIFNILPWIVDKCSLLDHPKNWKREALIMYHGILWALVLTPFTILIMQVLASSHKEYRGIRELLWYLFSCLVSTGFIGVLTPLTYWAADSTECNIILHVLTLIVIVAGRCFLHE